MFLYLPTCGEGDRAVGVVGGFASYSAFFW